MPTKQRTWANWEEVPQAEAWPTGNVFLDWMTGIGGLPKGRVVETFGPESSGKSTLGLQTAGHVWQSQGIPSWYVDFEDTFDARYARALGLTKEGLLIDPAIETLEDFFEGMEDFLRDKNPLPLGLVVFDSVAAGRTRDDLKNSDSDNRTAGMNRARLWTQWLSTNVSRLNERGITLVLVNQLRDFIDTDSGFKPPGMAALQPKNRTPGGRGIKFYSSLRLSFEPTTEIKRQVINPLTKEPENQVVGKNVWLKVVKNKVAPPPWRKVRMEIRDGMGFDLVTNLMKFAETHDILQRKSGVWTFPERFSGTGESFTVAAAGGFSGDEVVAQLLRQRPGITQALTAEVAQILAEAEHLLVQNEEITTAEEAINVGS